MTDIADQPNCQVEADLDLYGDDVLDSQFTEHDVLGTTDSDDDDLGNPDENDIKVGENAVKKEGDDAELYDAAIEPSNDASVSKSPEFQMTNNKETQPTELRSGRRYCCYIGNMTWWTTDADLQDAIYGSGIGDLVDIKFHENRNNGQSKGFALTVFAAESAVRQCMDKLPQKQLHGQSLVVLPYTKSSLAKFEEATRRPGDQRGDKKGDKKDESKGMHNFGTIRIGATLPPRPLPPPLNLGPGPVPLMTRPGVPLLMGPRPIISMSGPSHAPLLLPSDGRAPVHLLAHAPSPLPPRLAPVPNIVAPPLNPPPAGLNRPPPLMAAYPGSTSFPPRNVAPGQPLPLPPLAGFPPPGAHINPQVYPGFVSGAPPPPSHQSIGAGPPPTAAFPIRDAPTSEAEFEEIMNRNRTVSSSAISRAVSDAAAGDYASAIETLVTAISLIRQSRVANDDRCKVLITSLQDTLHGIETKSYARGGSRKDRSRDRSRSPEQRSRKRHRRSSRSRSRSRDRYEYSPRHSGGGRRY